MIALRNDEGQVIGDEHRDEARDGNQTRNGGAGGFKAAQQVTGDGAEEAGVTQGGDDGQDASEAADGAPIEVGGIGLVGRNEGHGDQGGNAGDEGHGVGFGEGDDAVLGVFFHFFCSLQLWSCLGSWHHVGI